MTDINILNYLNRNNIENYQPYLDTVKVLKNYCFANTKTLTSIVIPTNIEQIGNNCFSNCPNLKTITINKPTDSISGAPWGATNATVIWNG